MIRLCDRAAVETDGRADEGRGAHSLDGEEGDEWGWG